MADDADAAGLEGGCQCRAVRYRLGSAPIFVNCCHCTDCQTETGTAFVVNAMIEADRVELLAGAPEATTTPSASGRGQRIWRCPDCRVAVWSHFAGAGPAIHFLRVGTLDTPAALPPDAFIFIRSKLPWVVLPEGVPAFDGFYDAKATWPPASLDRVMAAKRSA